RHPRSYHTCRSALSLMGPAPVAFMWTLSRGYLGRSVDAARRAGPVRTILPAASRRLGVMAPHDPWVGGHRGGGFRRALDQDILMRSPPPVAMSDGLTPIGEACRP